MIKRVVVGLDGSRFSEAATRIACELARRCDATAVGIGVVDLPGIEGVERGAPPGASYFAEKAEKHKLHDALKKIRKFLEGFEATCKESGIEYELLSGEGVPFQAIVDAGKVADLIVIGLKTFYHFETSSEPGDTLKRVLQHSVCPVMAVPEEMERIENVLMAYDGSTESAKALRAFVNRFSAILGHFQVTLLTNSDKEERAKEIQREALDYLKCWNIKPSTVVEGGRTHKAILRWAKRTDHPLVVMGAFGRRPISEFFFGSTTRHIVEDSTVPIMVYH